MTMLKVIGAGFPRTGTTSMKAALEQLGFGPCHHMVEVAGDTQQADRWQVAASDPNVDWDWVLQGYHAAVDWPSAYFWRQLSEVYPDAKVILTVRDPHRWYASVRDTIFAVRRTTRAAEDFAAIARVAPGMARMGPLVDVMWEGTFGQELGDEMPPEDHAVQVFDRHIATVRQTIDANRLLVHEARDGWGPLCEFLGVDVPEGPYPHLNDGDAMREALERVRQGGPLEMPARPPA